MLLLVETLSDFVLSETTTQLTLNCGAQIIHPALFIKELSQHGIISSQQLNY